MEFKDDEIKRLQLAAEAEEKKRFLRNVGSLDQITKETHTQNSPAPPVSHLEEPEHSPLKQIRTYQGDVASALQKQNESIASIQKREAVKREDEQRAAEPEKKTNWKTIVLSIFIILFIGLGSFGGYWAYLKFKNQRASPVMVTPANRLIQVREVREINALTLNREQLTMLVREEARRVTSPDQRGEIIQINLRKGEGELAELFQTSEFLVLMETRAPGALVRAFDPLFMLGVSGAEISKPFILVKLKSFEQAYPGMLFWEENLREDLLPLFLDPEQLAAVSSENKFEDITLANKDARLLKDDSGKTVLIYTFLNNEVLLITDDENGLRTIQNLYLGGKLSR